LVLDEGQEVLFVGGFLSELYEELSVNLEDQINEALQDAARALNVHIDLPFARDIDIPIGDSIANALPRVDLPIKPGGFVSFYRQMQYFDAQGIAYRNLSAVSEAFDTSASVKHNAAALLEVLRSTKKRIIIVSHSKGSLDTLDALLQAPQLVGTRVVGWVAIQAPFHGSPVADSTFAPVNGLLLEALGGNGQSVEDLKTKVREPYMQANKARIEALTARIPVISAYSTYEASGGVTGFARTFASSIFNARLASKISAIVVRNYRETPRDVARVVAASTSEAIRLVRERVAVGLNEAMATIGLVDFTNAYMNDTLDLPNDGLVPQQSTELPGAIHAELVTGDHASPVMDVDPYKNYWSVEERNAITAELIREVRRLAKTARQ
jgi:pimeloyl-ACP methyl ester carboxylesterase